jgi:hypothetical protein
MVTSSIDANPLNPETRFTYGENSQKAPHQSDLDVIMDRNVAPYGDKPYRELQPLLTFPNSSPREVCADLAQQHALEDLHDVTEHSSEQHASMNCGMSSFLSRNYPWSIASFLKSS